MEWNTGQHGVEEFAERKGQSQETEICKQHRKEERKRLKVQIKNQKPEDPLELRRWKESKADLGLRAKSIFANENLSQPAKCCFSVQNIEPCLWFARDLRLLLLKGAPGWDEERGSQRGCYCAGAVDPDLAL